MGVKLFVPNVVSFGFGLFFATFATSAWGGAFPMLPTDFQTYDVLIAYFLMESLSFCAMYFVGMVLSFTNPVLLRHRSSVLGSPLMVAGSLCLIAPLYYEPGTMFFTFIGGILFGLGAALSFLSWQRLFASKSNDRGTLDLIIGMALSAPLYALMHIIPSAVAAFSIPLVFIPLSEVCLIDASRSIDFNQPMFTDEPRHHRRVYHNAILNCVKSAFYVGAFGFASGITRAIAVKDPAMGVVVNAFAMVGLLVASTILLWLWRRHSFSFDTNHLFRLAAPVVVTAFLLMPYLNEMYLHVFSGVMYMFFSFAVMVMMVQCMQISRNNGISPTFIYGFFGGIVYTMQACGFLFGYGTETLTLNASPQLATFALMATWLFMMVAMAANGRMPRVVSTIPDVEFVVLAQPLLLQSEATSSKVCDEAVTPKVGNDDAFQDEEIEKDEGKKDVTNAGVVKRKHANGGLPIAQYTRKHAYGDERKHGISNRQVDAIGIKDRISKQALVLTRRYLLTAREAEVMELLVRGNTAADIANKLTISENTAKTHIKRLYTKLDVHKRRELLTLFEELDD